MFRTRAFLVPVALLVVAAACGRPPGVHPVPVNDRIAPDSFLVAVNTTRGTVVVAIHRDWAPRGVDRFYALVDRKYYDGARLFRVVPGFVAQFGLAADPRLTAAFRPARIPDDPPAQRNVRGTLSFASGGPGTRTTQLFFNLADNSPRLDQGYPPIGRVVQGIDAIDHFTSDYAGRMPDGVQDSIARQGERYLRRAFPRLDVIRTIRVIKTWK